MFWWSKMTLGHSNRNESWYDTENSLFLFLSKTRADSVTATRLLRALLRFLHIPQPDDRSTYNTSWCLIQFASLLCLWSLRMAISSIPLQPRPRHLQGSLRYQPKPRPCHLIKIISSLSLSLHWYCHIFIDIIIIMVMVIVRVLFFVMFIATAIGVVICIPKLACLLLLLESHSAPSTPPQFRQPGPHEYHD